MNPDAQNDDNNNCMSMYGVENATTMTMTLLLLVSLMVLGGRKKKEKLKKMKVKARRTGCRIMADSTGAGSEKGRRSRRGLVVLEIQRRMGFAGREKDGSRAVGERRL